MKSKSKSKQSATTTATKLKDRIETLTSLQDRVAWVRGCGTATASAGIGYVDGKLCYVCLSDGMRQTFDAEPIGLAAAARKMRDLFVAEIDLGLEILATDNGMLRWLAEIQSELP